MKILRTPDACFEGIADYPAPHYHQNCRRQRFAHSPFGRGRRQRTHRVVYARPTRGLSVRK